ncbi:MCE family protein [Mycobacterium deserti]|uniref:MCE family protein n=1 Tax=Mycobacterium deserti TaxID=2978347 RepID=A0ABT2MID1_9MYCO|nr:MCE family protein [Mycobacterium deserti]MCT7660736.1 MCE family protein [Mycobacterium deserti]
MTARNSRIGLAAVLIVLLVGGMTFAAKSLLETHRRVTVVGYFANANGIFVGDDVRILGVPVGRIDAIEPQATGVRITFWYNGKYRVPATANAAILSPSLVTARTIQLTPAYTDGPVMETGAVIPKQRTAVPVEWDELQKHLLKLTESLEPTEPGGVSTMGALVNTAAENLRGQGTNIRDTILKLSQAFSALGDHSNDLFSTIKNLSVFVSALQSSGDLLQALNMNLATVSGLLATDDDAIAEAITDLNAAVANATSFVNENRESIGTFSDKFTGVTTALIESLDSIKQILHVTPTSLQNFANSYSPARGAMTGGLAVNNFADPISFLCGGIEAASRLNAEQSAKLCAQYLAPIIKNRQYNFPPIGFGPFGPAIVGAQARPNEVTYSEDRLRPDYRPIPVGSAAPDPGDPPPPPLAAEAQPDAAAAQPEITSPAAIATDPAAGLPGLMIPPGAGS